LLVKAGDTVTVKSRPRSLQLVKLNLQENPPPVPDFLERTGTEPPEGRMTRLPTRADVDPRLYKDKELREQLIIEVATRQIPIRIFFSPASGRLTSPRPPGTRDKGGFLHADQMARPRTAQPADQRSQHADRYLRQVQRGAVRARLRRDRRQQPT